MDNVLREFLASGKTLITDTMARKSTPVKKMVIAPIEPCSWDKVLISRCKDEKIKKAEVVAEFKKIIAQAEELI